jgi:hypothetical protein
MITNKNNIAIAPTYIIIKAKPKKSIFIRKRIKPLLMKVKISKRTECIKLSTIKMEAESVPKRLNKIVSLVIVKF